MLLVDVESKYFLRDAAGPGDLDVDLRPSWRQPEMDCLRCLRQIAPATTDLP